MAVIGKIRNNPLIVLLFIGGGVALFILSEMTSGASGPVGPAEQIMARVGEMEIERNEFERTLGTAFSGGNSFENRDNLFNLYVQQGLINGEAEEIGVTVSKDELYALEFGPNYSRIVSQNFLDRNTGQMNPMLNQIRDAIDAGTVTEDIEDGKLPRSIPDFWNYQRRNVITQRLQEKMTAMVTKGMYAPKWQAQNFADRQIAGRRVAIASIPYGELADLDVELTDDDYQAYIDEYRNNFNNPEASRQIAYVAIPVEATEADIAKISKDLEKAKASWLEETTTRGDSLFALSNQGTYTGRYQTADDLNPDIASVMTESLEEGGIYGPYREGEAIKLAKLIEKDLMADSATVRHILIRSQGVSPDARREASELADSLLTVLRANRGKFADLAEEFSGDFASSGEGGVLEDIKPGQGSIPNFDETIFAEGRVGQLYLANTPMGAHVVEITKRSTPTTPYVKVAYAVEPIIPSQETENAALATAQELLSETSSLEGLRKLAEEDGLEVKSTTPLPQSAYRIAGLGNGDPVQKMMCWAFDAREGEIANQVYTFTDELLGYEKYYVVAGLEKAFNAGITPVDAVRDNLEEIVGNRKKGEQLKTSITSIADATSRYPNATVDTVNANATLTTLPGMDAEPKIIAAAVTLPTGQAGTLVGNNGVYVVQPVTDAGTGTSGSLPQARLQLHGQIRSRAGRSLLPALRATTDIADDRAATVCNR